MKPNSSPAPTFTAHVLKTSIGIACKLTLREIDFQMSCQWSRKPMSKDLPALHREYIPWRNAIIKGWSERNGKSVLVVTC